MGGLIIAGDRSGSGKTTVTLALLCALRARGAVAQAFKVGPDYIDPMFHRAITGRPAYNLDPVLTSEAYVQRCFQQHSANLPYVVVEGVMGLFDGAGGTDWASTAHIARLLHCPVVLAVDCSRLSRSLAAIVHGYQTFDPQVTIAAVVLNRVGSDRHRAMLLDAMATLPMPVAGVLHRDVAVTLPDRHLGLVPTAEIANLSERFQHLAAVGQQAFDWSQLERLFAEPPNQGSTDRTLAPKTSKDITSSSGVSEKPLPSLLAEVDRAKKLAAPRLRIGIARDRAFNFYYQDNLDMLKGLGADLVPFSPLADEVLPPNLAGLYLGGGFPEVFAADLAGNVTLRQRLAQQIAAGLPVYGECGGLMYLCQQLIDFDGNAWPMVGAIAATTTMTAKLTLGYRQVTVQRGSSMVQPGQQFWGHEFHRSSIQPLPTAPLYSLTSYGIAAGNRLPRPEGWSHQAVHGSYVHLHWGDHPELPAYWLQCCRQWQQDGGDRNE